MALSPLIVLPSNVSGNQPELNITISTTAFVWFQWTCPQTGPYIFSTRGKATNFPTNIGVYTSNTTPPNDITNLTQVPYIRDEEQFGIGGGYEFASHVAFQATSGTIYYIGILMRADYGPFVAPFNLLMVWGIYQQRLLTSCGGGTPLNYGGLQCVGVLQIGDVTAWDYESVKDSGNTSAQVSFSFGSFPQRAGWFAIRYIGGSLMVLVDTLSGTPNVVGVDAGYGPATGQLFSGGVDVTGPFYGNDSFGVNGNCIEIFPSEYDASTSLFQCTQSQFNNTAGEIKSVFTFGHDSLGNNLCTYNSAQFEGGHQIYWDSSTEPSTVMIEFASSGESCEVDRITALPDGTGRNVLQNPIPVAFTEKPINGITSNYYLPLLQNSTQNPILQLLYKDILQSYFSMNNFGGVKSASLNWQTISLQFTNSDGTYNWDGVSIALSFNGGSVVATNTVTFTTQTISSDFTFPKTSVDPTIGFLNGTFTFSRNGVVFGTLSAPFYPVFNVQLVGNSGFYRTVTNGATLAVLTTGTIPGCPSTIKGIQIDPGVQLLNGGNAINWFGGVLQYIVSSTTTMYDSSATCAIIPNGTVVTNGDNFWVQVPASGKTSSITITPIWTVGGITAGTYPTVTFPVQWP